MTKNNRKKRGFTIVETIIAMVVVVVVSIAAGTATLAGIQAARNVERDADAVRCAENVLECFKVTDNRDDFLLALSDVEGGELTVTDWGAEVDYPIHIKTNLESRYTIRICYEPQEIAVSVVANDTEGNPIITDENELLVEYSYKKGGAA